MFTVLFLLPLLLSLSSVSVVYYISAPVSARLLVPTPFSVVYRNSTPLYTVYDVSSSVSAVYYVLARVAAVYSVSASASDLSTLLSLLSTVCLPLYLWFAPCPMTLSALSLLRFYQFGCVSCLLSKSPLS